MLCSGGKDSNLALLRLKRAGHEVALLVSVVPAGCDSWMFHLPNVSLVGVQAACMGIPHEAVSVSGEKEEEVGELREALSPIQERWRIEGIGTGAIASRYQRERIDRVCSSLGLEALSPLWGEGEESLLREIIREGMEVYFTSVSAEGLDRGWLGRRLDDGALLSLLRIRERYGVNISGEGGEYETFVCDSPLFRKRIVVTSAETAWSRNCGTWTIRSYTVAEKRPLQSGPKGPDAPRG